MVNNHGENHFGHDDGSPSFRALLSPHRSLSAKGFKIMMAVTALMCLSIGLWFYAIGAWPVMGFMGLDVLILYLAFKMSYRQGLVYETIELTSEKLTITHHPLHGEQKQWHFNPYWVKLKIKERRGKSCIVEASSHGKKLIFANFLSDNEKRDFTRCLNQALSALRIN